MGCRLFKSVYLVFKDIVVDNIRIYKVSKKSDAKNAIPGVLSVNELDFDPSNPRFAIELASGPLDRLLDRMIRDERLQELMQSIGLQGYFDGEPLLVTRAENGRYHVVEGNRRLAALKLLNGQLNPAKPLPSINAIRDEAVFKPEKVPCLVFEERKNILRYLGFRHITGIKAWGPLAKARYLEQLRIDWYEDVDESSQLKQLAKEIGSRPDYVGQMLAGLNLYNIASESGFFGLQHITEDTIEFTLLTTALSYTNIVGFIGLESRQDLRGENVSINNLKDLFTWLYAQNQQGNTIVPNSRNLKELAKVVDCKPALEKLREKGDLAEAFVLTEGPQLALSKQLADAHKKLRAAYDVIPMVPEVNSAHETQIDEILSLARKIKILIQVENHE